MACEDEPDNCKRARKEYNDAYGDYLQSVCDINSTKGNRNAAGGVGGAGLAVGAGVALASGPVGWIVIGIVLAVGGGSVAAHQQSKLNTARAKCKALLSKMYTAFLLAEKYCKSKECIPPRPTQSCP